MTNVEVEAALPIRIQTAQMLENACGQVPAEAIGLPFEKAEQLDRRPAAEDSSKAIVLNDRLGLVREMPQISQAHPVDPGREAAFPATPDQPRHIEQIGGVVCHLEQ